MSASPCTLNCCFNWQVAPHLESVELNKSEPLDSYSAPQRTKIQSVKWWTTIEFKMISPSRSLTEVSNGLQPWFYIWLCSTAASHLSDLFWFHPHYFSPQAPVSYATVSFSVFIYYKSGMYVELKYLNKLCIHFIVNQLTMLFFFFLLLLINSPVCGLFKNKLLL